MSKHLDAPEKPALNLGYLRLTDSAPFIVARELGLFAKYGLDVTLHREVSWANVRDKLAVGALDAAQMLAPLPAMTTLGVSGLRVPMLTGLVLSMNGNAITLAAGIADALAVPTGRGAPAALENAIALGRWSRSQGHRLNLGVVHSFSTHAIQLRAWLQAGGIDPDTEVRTLVVPPSQMIDSLEGGVIDGYCVGEPWSTIAVHEGLGHIVAFGQQIWENAPEKVLAVTEDWHRAHPATHLRLRLSLMEACSWLADTDNRPTAAHLIGAHMYLGLPVSELLPSLTGDMTCVPGGEITPVKDFHVFSSGHAGMPRQETAAFTIERCAELFGRPLDARRIASLVQRTTRPDLYLAALEHLGGKDPANAPFRRSGAAFALKRRGRPLPVPVK